MPSPMGDEPVNLVAALGRPLSYEEYMESNSKSYMKDPWNFDPLMRKSNQYSKVNNMRYNYDPLGMCAYTFFL